jgi:hypothetical protein
VTLKRIATLGLLLVASRAAAQTVDKVKYSTLQACVNAAAALPTPGTCYVPTGASVAFSSGTNNVEMVSGVTLEFGRGTFINTGAGGAGGGIFVHLGSSVTGATVKGQGVGTSCLKNGSTGTQFGAVVQDEGRGNTVSDMTLDGNGNTTSTFIYITPIRPKAHNLKVNHDLSTVSGHNYAWDIRGGTEFEASNIEVNGGSLDGMTIFNFFDTSVYGNITGGRFSNLYLHGSPHNGLDVTSAGRNQTISGLEFSNVRSIGNGTSAGTGSDTHDDQYGCYFAASLSPDTSAIYNITFDGIETGNRGSGLRLKGNVYNSTFHTLSFANGSGTATVTDGLEAISLVTASGTTAPRFNMVTGQARPGSARYSLATDANTFGNRFVVDLGAGSVVSLGNTNDHLQSYTAQPADHP